MAASMSLCTSNHLPWKSQTTRNAELPIIQLRPSSLSRIYQRKQQHYVQSSGRLSRTFVVFAATEGSTKSSKSDEQIPSWARPDADEPPPWARDEGNASTSQSTFEIPFYAYLLASAITAIAAVSFSYHFTVLEYSKS